MPKKESTSTTQSQTPTPEADPQLLQLQQELEDLQHQQQESLAQSQRALADYANLKKRFEKERLEISSYATESIISQIIPAIDNLDRAVTFASDQEKQQPLYQGLHMTVQQLQQIFTQLGLSQIEATEGQDFDPHIHEAIDTTTGPAGKIIKQHQPGYQLHSRIIRPAQVSVGDGQTKN